MMKMRSSSLVAFLSLLCLAAWGPKPQATAQTPLGLSIQMNAGEAQLIVTGAVKSACQIQWTDNLSITSRWLHLDHYVLTAPPALLTDSTSSSANNRYYRAVWTPNTNLVWIPPGTFTMGSPANEVDRSAIEGPQMSVTISRGFWMRKYLVTQEDYLSVVGSNPSYFTGYQDLPVESLSWHDATNYCAELTQQEQAAGRVPAGWVYRLPTEAEWEYACRAGTTTRFYYGDDLGYTNLTNYGWFADNSDSVTQPVGLLLPNAWGLYDMAGNVWEWCRDWYGSYPGGSLIDPQGPVAGTYRVMRGGSCYNVGRYLRSARRLNNLPTYTYSGLGLRVVLAFGQP
jgi:formylglycine-generating enzyme required for sulfatase activity